MAKLPPWQSPDQRDPRGRVSRGRVAILTRGRGNGFIRDAKADLFYFSRSGMLDGSFNDLNVGDIVTFEVIEDHVSGHRAARVARKK